MNDENQNTGLKVALLLLFLFAIGGVIAFFYKEKVENNLTEQTTNIANTKVTFTANLDAWPGYIPIASKLLQNKLLSQGINLQWSSDKGDYNSRIEALNSGNIDMAVITVDAHQLNKIKETIVGVEVLVIDESHGGDSVIAWRDCNISKVSDLNSNQAYSSQNTNGWKMAYLENTPSHELVRTIGRDLGIDLLLKSDKEWFVTANSDKEIYEKFKNHEVCVIATWEPWRSKLLAIDGTVEIYSSKNADKDIVDVLLVSRKILDASNEKNQYLETILNTYFDVLQELKSDNGLMLEQAKKFLQDFASMGNLSDDEIQSMINGVKWINLKDNAELWFGLAGKKYFGLIEAHENARNIISADELHPNHLKGFDFNSILNSEIVRKLYLKGGYSQSSDNTTETDSLKKSFPELNDQAWNVLVEIGELNAKPLIFLSGTSSLDENSAEIISEIMDEFRKYANFRLELVAGYNPEINSQEEKSLAEQRAKNTLEYLISNYGIDRNRVRINIPNPDSLKKIIATKANESTRGYGSRLRQVHFLLKNAPR